MRQSQPDRMQAAGEEPLVRSLAARYSAGTLVPPHRHEWHQLIYAREGVMWVQTEEGDWVVPPNRAVWVPAGVRHGIEMVGPVFIHTLYLAAGIAGELPPSCCAVNVSPLLREIVLRTIELGMLHAEVPAQGRLLGVLVDQVSGLPAIPLQLPSPSDERARRAAAWLKAHPDDAGSIGQMAKRVAASARTLERLFHKETGLTFGRWRQQLRLLQALRLLAAGRPVTAVALEVGYESTSAFIAMFKRALGTTPRRYFGGRR